MKLWIKYLFGIVIGILASFVIPFSSPMASSFLAGAYEFVIRFGRYLLLPMLFFSLSSAIFKLRSAKSLVRVTVWTISSIVISSFLLTVFGVVSALIIHLPRVPITVEKVTGSFSLPIREMIMSIFPYSGFEALKEGAFLFPCFVFAGFAGAGCVTDPVASKPVITFIDSASRLCYSIVSFFTEILSVGMVAIMTSWMVQSVPVFKSGIFNSLFFMLTADFIVVAFIIFPLILRLLCSDKKPYRTLYASITPILVSFFSGDTNLSLLLNMRHGKESLGIHHRLNAVSYTLFSIFGRGGVAMVISVSFITILRSYSSLSLTASDIFWVFGMTFGISFLLGALPRGCTYSALIVMCTVYGRGFETGYLLLKAAAPVLCSFACALDTVCAMFGSYIIGVKTRHLEHIEIKHYI